MKKLQIALILFYCFHYGTNAQLSCAGLTQVNFTFTGAPQTFTVPAGVTSIIIKTRGATGGLSAGGGFSAGGGAVVEGQYTVTPGSILTILVGGRGANGDFEGGGGGSTGVYIGATLYIVAGGGGGDDNTGNGGPGVITNNGTNGAPLSTSPANCPNNHLSDALGGIGGNGGNSGEFCAANNNGGGGGGGLNSAGIDLGTSIGGAQGSITGGAGGAASSSTGAGDGLGATGGWGWSGGGGADHRESGGGGGYSGGGGAPEGGNPGGGGSFLLAGFTASFTANGALTTTASDGLVSICYSAPSLPLLLLSLSGSSKETYNLIKWTTAEEFDLHKFQVERSVDGRNFSVIGELPPTNNNRGNTYEFRDNNITGLAVLYYRLRILENDGSSSFSFIISIKTRGQSQNFSVYPNPVKDQLTIGSNMPVLKLEIINMLGEIVYSSKKINLTVPVSLSHLSKGVYIIKAYTEAGVVSEKFIKN
jgi:hypothetical protein